MLKTKPDYRIGDIVEWDNVALGKRQWRVVQVWTEGEPFRLLVTPVGDYSEGKCFPVTCDDVTLVTRGAPEDAEFKRKDLGGSYARNPKRSEEPSKHPIVSEPCP
jgi:hypothetical protein